MYTFTRIKKVSDKAWKKSTQFTITDGNRLAPLFSPNGKEAANLIRL